MEASINKERKHAFIVRQDEVKKIWDLLQSRIGPVILQVNCSDEISREFKSLQEFKRFENPPQKKIVRMTFNAHSEGRKKTAEIEFSKGDYRVIDIRLNASDQVLSRLYDDVCDILDGMRAWYSILSRLDFGYLMIAVFWVISSISWLNKSNNEKPPELDMTIEIVAILGLLIVGGAIVFGVLVWLLNKLKGVFFPIATFAIGQGLERYNIDEKIRWAIVVGFVVSLSASLVVGLI